MVGTAKSVASAVAAWWHLVMDEPAAALVVVMVAAGIILGSFYGLNKYFEPRSEASSLVTSFMHQIGSKLDNISCEVQWNRHSSQMQNYRVQERALSAQILMQRRFINNSGNHSSEHDQAILDGLHTQLQYVQREEKALPVPPCDFPFRG